MGRKVWVDFSNSPGQFHHPTTKELQRPRFSAIVASYSKYQWKSQSRALTGLDLSTSGMWKSREQNRADKKKIFTQLSRFLILNNKYISLPPPSPSTNGPGIGVPQHPELPCTPTPPPFLSPVHLLVSGSSPSTPIRVSGRFRGLPRTPLPRNFVLSLLHLLQRVLCHMSFFKALPLRRHLVWGGSNPSPLRRE